jgi:voltage-gated potassium channel
VILGQIAGRRESCSRLDALYRALVTATTVGYGDCRPRDQASRVLSVPIASCGVIFTGIMVAAAVTATSLSVQSRYDASGAQPVIEFLDD